MVVVNLEKYFGEAFFASLNTGHLLDKVEAISVFSSENTPTSFKNAVKKQLGDKFLNDANYIWLVQPKLEEEEVATQDTSDTDGDTDDKKEEETAAEQQGDSKELADLKGKIASAIARALYINDDVNDATKNVELFNVVCKDKKYVFTKITVGDK